MFIEEDEAREILAPHEVRIAAVMDRAWKQVSNNSDRASLSYKRAVACMMHNFMMNELRVEYADDAPSSAYLIEGHETIRLLIERRLVVRVKKMDEHGVTRAQPTQASLAFVRPMAWLAFDPEECPPTTPSVDIGYVLNDLETRIISKLVAARDGDAVLWSYAIGSAAPAAYATLAPVTTPPTSPSTIIKVPTERPARKRQRD